jgi:hypothetical protein
MKLLRIKDHATYHKMTDFEKTCYRAGLPHRYVGHLVKGMSFIDYKYGGEFPKTVTGIKQRKWTIKFKKNMSRHGDINGIVGLYSSPTDEAAFECAGSIFEAGIRGGLTCRCISATMVKENFRFIPPSDMYLIYGITDMPNPATAWAVRDFLRERDGSLRLVVMTAGIDSTPWDLIHNVLKMNFNVILALSDENNIAGGSLETLR